MTLFDTYHLFRREDQPYFRRFEEERLGIPLVEALGERERHVPAFHISLHPARRALKHRPYLGGEAPSYADFVLHAAFEWARTVSDFKLLRDDDRLHGWIAAMDDRHATGSNG
jgi:glutathione S-transferase